MFFRLYIIPSPFFTFTQVRILFYIIMRLHKLLVLSTAAPWAAAQYVTGIKAGVNEQTGERPARLNINDMHRAAGPAWCVNYPLV